jgi:hypothetical protein
MTIRLNTLLLGAILLASPALAATDPHAGHHPSPTPSAVVPPTTPAEADAPKMAGNCPMMTGQGMMKGQGTSAATPAMMPAGGMMMGQGMMGDMQAMHSDIQLLRQEIAALRTELRLHQGH